MKNKTLLTVNLNVSFECDYGTKKEYAEKELDSLLDNIQLLTDHRIIFSQYETSEIKNVMVIWKAVFIMKSISSKWFVADNSGNLAGHDLNELAAQDIAAKMSAEEPNAGWEALEEE
jgi:hypothetical protein